MENSTGVSRTQHLDLLPFSHFFCPKRDQYIPRWDQYFFLPFPIELCWDCFPLNYCFVVGWSLGLWGQPKSSLFCLLFMDWCGAGASVYVIPSLAVRGLLKTLSLNTNLFTFLSTPMYIPYNFNEYMFTRTVDVNDELLQLIRCVFGGFAALKLDAVTVSECHHSDLRPLWRHVHSLYRMRAHAAGDEFWALVIVQLARLQMFIRVYSKYSEKVVRVVREEPCGFVFARGMKPLIDLPRFFHCTPYLKYPPEKNTG